jgi:uncharacterized protein YbjT (DUF2867 family)
VTDESAGSEHRPTFLVTGATSGLGEAIATQLSERGARVLMGARTPERGQAAADRIRSRVPDADLEVAVADLSRMGPYVNGSRVVAGFTPCFCLGVRIRRGRWWVLSWEVGVVERRSEEQGVEAGSSATQLAVRQSVVPLLRQPHPPRLRTELCLFSGRAAPCATVWASPEWRIRRRC